MATGCGDKKKGGSCLFKSENFVNWTAVGWLDQPQGPVKEGNFPTEILLEDTDGLHRPP